MWVLGSLQHLTQHLVPQLSTCQLAAEGSGQQLHVVQSLTNENWTFRTHFVGIALISQCLNTLQKPERLRWFLLGREGGSCCLSLSLTRMWRLFSSFPLSSSKRLQTLYENVIFSQTVAFPSSLLAFPGLCSQSAWSQPLHVCNVSNVPAADAAEPAEGGRCSGGCAGGAELSWGASSKPPVASIGAHLIPQTCSKCNKAKPSCEVVQ